MIFKPISKPFIIIIIALAVWTIWLTILGSNVAFSYVRQYWQIAITMIGGSIIAGGTSVGGGAVAFPVFTKLLNISPHDAKVFSLAIQSVGMGAASLTIWLTGIKVEWRVIFWGSMGGLLGIFWGLNWLAPILPPDLIKICFTVTLSSLAITLLALNKTQRQCNFKVPIWTKREILISLIAGFIGGLISGLVGNGIDILLFSVMVILFRISEKIATPTSVILMAINAIAGFGLEVFVLDEFIAPISSYWLAAIPVVVIGAPLGAILSNLLKRSTIANILIALILIELVTSLILIPLRPIIIHVSLTALLIFSGANYWMYCCLTYEPILKPEIRSYRGET